MKPPVVPVVHFGPPVHLVTPQAGQILSGGKGRYFRVEQVRSNGDGGLGYALVRPCGPKGRAHAHSILGDIPIAIRLLPGGVLPTGYELHKEA